MGSHFSNVQFCCHLFLSVWFRVGYLKRATLTYWFVYPQVFSGYCDCVYLRPSVSGVMSTLRIYEKLTHGGFTYQWCFVVSHLLVCGNVKIGVGGHFILTCSYLIVHCFLGILVLGLFLLPEDDPLGFIVIPSAISGGETTKSPGIMRASRAYEIDIWRSYQHLHTLRLSCYAVVFRTKSGVSW